MNYSGNMPDWHQYNPPQSGINDVTSTAQNVNSGHLSFISSISPTCPTQLNGLNLSSEGLEKHQNDSNFNPRHFQPHLSSNISHGHNATDNNPLASMVQMQNCIGHYGPSNTRNPMVDNLNGPMDPRNTAIGGINEELGYRNNQVPLNGPISHLNGPNVMNMNAPHASMGSRNTNVNSHAASRTGPPPSFVPCKGLCCNPDPNISYQQYCSYPNNATYRENIRTSTGYQTDTRRFGNDYNFRKDNFDGKEVLSPMVPPPNGPNADHRRNFSDFKYRKDRLISRNYPSSSSMLPNYPMQNYNYTGEYQKYPYNVKEYSKMSSMNVPNQGMVKHPEQGFAMPQQKYNNKQVPYQTGGAMISTNMPSTSVPNLSMMPPAQNTYFNSQYPRNLSTDASHDCQEAADNASMVNRMQTMQTSTTMHTPSHSRYQQTYHKIAIQRFSMENHLRDLAKIPGYQSHPKYKECVHKYREILKLQQSHVTYQGQSMQQTPCVTTTTSTVNTSAIPPINLQFDQNGVLINSNYMPEAFPRVQQAVNSQAPVDNPVDKQSKQDGIPEMANRNVKKPEQLVSQQHDGHAIALCVESMQKQDQYPAQKSLEQNQFEIQKTGSESFNNLTGNANVAVIQQKISKEFADKPELDVRQFLANWDESEDEDGASTNLPSAVLSDSTPVVVVGYENLSAKTLEGLEVSKPEEITPSVITFENQEKSDIGVVPAQDCLTISYSSAENVEIAKDPTCKDITKETIVRSGSHIIQCISNGPDEVPTIHIVDNLEIGSILQVTNGQVTETLQRQDAVSFFQEGTEVAAAAITLEAADKFKKTDSKTTESATTEFNADLGNLNKEQYVVEGPSPPKAVESTSQTSRVSDRTITALPTSAKDSARDTNLRKQNSFASEESHNPDDISLPDLPTSECTPISTTLNTPIHSDNEETSERVEDLTISTNPIEIIQNSPMISFTQSPTKREPYDHLNSEETVRNKPADSLEEGEYQTENHFKNNSGDNNMLGHDVILDTFEFSTNTDKNGSASFIKNGKEHANLNGTSVSANNEKIFALDETETVEATSMRMTLTSGEYELKIVSAGAQNKSVQAYKNLSERHANEPQATSPDAHTKSQTQTNAKVALQYNDSTNGDNTTKNVTNNPDPVVLDGGQDDYSGRRHAEMTCQTATSRVSSSLTNDIAPRSSRAEDTMQIVKSNSPTSHSAKQLTLDNDKLRKAEASFANEDSSTEKSANSNKSTKIDATDSKNSQHAKLADRKKSVSGDQAISHKKRCLSENTEDRCSETIVHHNKHTQEAATHKDKSCTVENPKGFDNSHNKPRVIENISITDSGERMRLLKEYRRIKYKSHSVSKVHDKGKDTQEVSDYAASKTCHRSSNPDERSESQSSCDNQLCQKDVARSKSSEEQEGKHANILKTFVAKNKNPDFAIQVTNVNLKLKDDDHQKGSQHSREEAKSSGSLDGIKIEINVSCTERNTTEKLLHENIKNAVAETIGHLTNTISNSTNITDKKMICDKADRQDYEKRNRSPSALTEASAYNEAHEDHNNTVKSVIACEEDTNNETLSKKRRSSLSAQKLINDVYEDSGTVNTESELTSSALKISRSEHATSRRRSVHQDAERKVATTNFGSEELKASSDNLPYLGLKTVNVQKKEHQQIAVASPCRNARNFQDDAAPKLNAVPSTSSSTVEPTMEDASYNNPVHFDYNHFDVAPNESTDVDDRRADRWKRPKRDGDRFGNFDLYETTSGYVNPTFFSADELENLNVVPVYTTKDGKITYSPNPRFTYRELLMEARMKDGYGNSREPYFARSPPYNYYNCSKLRKVFKRNRDVTTAGRKKEIDPTDAKSAVIHVDYSNKNAVHKNANCAKSRGTHLEFFNDDANKLYANKNDQESKEANNKKNIIDLDFLEKQYNLDSTEPPANITSNINKDCKTKVFADNLEHEKGYNESSVFESNLFLEPRAACWEETMESIKSYSSHIDRRNSGNVKELNFSDIFAAQKRLDTFPFLPAEQDSSDNGIHKANCNVMNESTLHHTTCNYIDDLRSIQDDDLRYESSNAALCNEQENECNNQKNASTDVIDKPVSILNINASLSTQNNDEHTKKQESQFDGNESSAIGVVEKVRSRDSPKLTDEKIHDPEGNQSSTSYEKNKEASTEQSVEDDSHLHCDRSVSPKKDKLDAEVANTKEISNEDSAKVASPSKLNVESKDSLDEPKNMEIVKESTLALNERDNEINDSMKNDSDSVNQETIYQPVLSASIDHKDKEKTTLTESNVSTEITFDQADKKDMCDRGDTTISKEDEPNALQNPSNVTFIEQTLAEEGNKQQSEISEIDRQKAEVSLKNRGNDEVDTCSTIISTSTALNLRTEKNICDLFPSERHEQNISDTSNKSVCQPKIPKMIIRNARSRPGTPSIEAVHEEIPASILNRTSLTIDDICTCSSESSLHESNSYRNKIPKMKIKLDEKHSNKIVRADDDEEVCIKRKNVKKTIPKVKIKSSSRSDLADNLDCNSMTSQESRDAGRYEEKIPILKLKKQERNRSSSPEVTRKRQFSSHYSEVPLKKCRRSERDDAEHRTRRSNSSESMQTNASECETKKNPVVCISEKIPKVIIKRTSASAEFKCELSKGYKNVIAKSAKWQPEVKLERYRILDSMVKDLKLTLSPITLRAIEKMSVSRKDSHRQKKQGDYKLSRSNSTSDLLPVKCKQRRMSDYDCRKINDASRVDVNFASKKTDSTDTKTCITPKKYSSSRGHKSTNECRKDNKRRSRSRDNNPRSEVDITSKEQDDDHFLSKDSDKIVIKNERLSNFNDIDNDCTVQDDMDLLNDSVSISDNFEMNNSTVIKVESSDESQSTIEILPASPDASRSELERNIMEDGDNDQLYSEDAIPTQFELELEIADNSNTDLLDISMPKLDPVTCYNSRRVNSTYEESSDQTAKLGRYKSEASSHGKNSLEKDKSFVEIGSDDRSELENSSANSAKEISSKAPCCRVMGFATTRENFCCNDSLIKEVLAAKETLKKCLSKSRYDVQGNAVGNTRPKTAAEKKQGSSFDINQISEVPSSDAQSCRSDVASQKGSPVASKCNKTEKISNTEKSDKKHSKSSKSSFMKKKSRSFEKNETDFKDTIKDTSKCNITSLKTSKQIEQAVSNESLTRSVHLNEKRKNVIDQCDDVPRSQDPQQKKEKNRLSSYKILKISRSTNQENNTNNAKEIKSKEDNMPILEPEVNVNFDTNSDRESSRSPPVITIQDSEDPDVAESKLIDDKVITSNIKVESNIKDIKKSEMSVVDLITQLAYHEKATIKDKRYCNLCEIWFDNPSQHERHLAGYEHRHIELTQRRSIHALFTLFTGKPCPKLVPANVVRSDCSIGELTPLQIAVQDVTKCFDCTQQSPRKENDVDK
ncbi:hypothetical protein ALC56_07913 [Trachymyrmex septentrionalis]|uniref:Uncharacterized protein n=1 Tax=Trachymyrmex septentrionalis TaxID=34720 RepID=A0A195FCE5_9HYME|nr:hypothetical protein ALC56_07913 [Trachymyrmex septentrionalis]